MSDAKHTPATKKEKEIAEIHAIYAAASPEEKNMIALMIRRMAQGDPAEEAAAFFTEWRIASPVERKRIEREALFL